MIATPMHHRAAALSDIGLHRRENEDRFVCEDRRGLYGVADGIGGLPHGELAAATAIEAVERLVAQSAAERATQDLGAIIATANGDVVQQGRQVSSLYGIGTTLTFGLLHGSLLRLAHVGDSRCYQFRCGRLERLTTDHNVESDRRLRHVHPDREGDSLRNRAALTRCIGQWTTPVADLSDHEIHAGDRILFCTDGLFRSVDDLELAAALASASDPARTLRDLIDLANRRGGYDNATAVLVLLD